VCFHTKREEVVEIRISGKCVAQNPTRRFARWVSLYDSSPSSLRLEVARAPRSGPRWANAFSLFGSAASLPHREGGGTSRSWGCGGNSPRDITHTPHPSPCSEGGLPNMFQYQKACFAWSDPGLASACRNARAKDPAWYDQLKEKDAAPCGEPEIGLNPSTHRSKGCGELEFHHLFPSCCYR
jgi:hypothetical protein